MGSTIRDEVWNVLRTYEDRVIWNFYRSWRGQRGWRAEVWDSFTPSSGLIGLTTFERINYGLECRPNLLIQFLLILRYLYLNAIHLRFKKPGSMWSFSHMNDSPCPYRLTRPQLRSTSPGLLFDNRFSVGSYKRTYIKYNPAARWWVLIPYFNCKRTLHARKSPVRIVWGWSKGLAESQRNKYVLHHLAFMFDKINAGRLWIHSVYYFNIFNQTLSKIAFLRNGNATTDTFVNKVRLKRLSPTRQEPIWNLIINIRGRPESPVLLSSGRLSRQTFRCSCVRYQTCLTPRIVLPLDRG